MALIESDGVVNTPWYAVLIPLLDLMVDESSAGSANDPGGMRSELFQMTCDSFLCELSRQRCDDL
jgi:hypothetical protein